MEPWIEERTIHDTSGVDIEAVQRLLEQVIVEIRKAPIAGPYESNQHNLVREACHALLWEIGADGMHGCLLCQA